IAVADFANEARPRIRTVPLPSVTALVTGQEGVYAATARGIVLVKHGGEIIRLAGPEAVSPGALAIEPSGSGERDFAGAAGPGPLVVDAGEWNPIRAPLPWGIVTAIVPAEAAIWIGTDEGLVRLSRAALENALALPRS